MIRGHIDLATRGRVEGWIHSDRLRLRGATVLAFHDDHCIGGGPVDVFRQDLADAGLGDGFVGFGFPVALAPGQDPRVIDVRLDGGTLLLKQGASALAPREALTQDRRRQGRDPAALSWMLGRGWLAQTQHDALRGLSRFGAHPLTLGIERRGRDARAVCDEVALHAAELLELYLQTAIDCEIRDAVRGVDLPDIRRALRNAFPHAPPVVGLWSAADRRIDVVEGSHLGGPSEPGAGLEYAFGGRTLLLLDLDAEVSLRAGEAHAPFTAFVPCRPEERR